MRNKDYYYYYNLSRYQMLYHVLTHLNFQSMFILNFTRPGPCLPSPTEFY